MIDEFTMPSQEDFNLFVENFLNKSSTVSATALGELALGDPTFVHSIKNRNRGCTLTTANKVISTIQKLNDSSKNQALRGCD